MRTRGARFGLTEGRAYSAVIVVVVLALLVPSLSHWRAVAAQKPLSGVTFAQRPPASTIPPTAPAALAAPPSGGTPSPGLGGFALGPVTALTLPSLGVGGLTTSSPPPPRLTPPPATALPTGPTCAAAALNTSVTKMLDALDASLNVLPTSTISTALGLATGCNTANPALVAVGALTELGDDLSQVFKDVPGASALKLPTVHPLELPAAVMPFLGGLKPVFSQICADINTASNTVLLIAPHYPQVIDGGVALALFQSAVTCAQLTGASS